MKEKRTTSATSLWTMTRFRQKLRQIVQEEKGNLQRNSTDTGNSREVELHSSFEGDSDTPPLPKKDYPLTRVASLDGQPMANEEPARNCVRFEDPSPPFHQSNLVTEKNKEPPDPLGEDLAFNRGDSDVEDNPEDRIFQEWKMGRPWL
uniref:Uncharacterized protein n=1 Tax=Ditylenchus dipsaci TaxID=166011 RepID=A0A915DCC9_9BILA